jgi:hypothetical protein
MRLRTTLAMIGLCLLMPGCQLAWDITTNMIFESCLFTDTVASKVQYRHQACEAWKQYRSSHAGNDYPADFVCGFKTGYATFLEEGGDVSPPPAPPLKYWKIRYQNASGRTATQSWTAGYHEGAVAAKASNARNQIIVPINACASSDPGTAPPTAPVLPPGATVVPPNVPSLPSLEPDLPAPRPAPVESAPPPGGKSGSANPTASPIRGGTAALDSSRAGDQPAADSDSAPLTLIESLVSPRAESESTPLLPIQNVLPGKEHPDDP